MVDCHRIDEMTNRCNNGAGDYYEVAPELNYHNGTDWIEANSNIADEPLALSSAPLCIRALSPLYSDPAPPNPRWSKCAPIITVCSFEYPLTWISLHILSSTQNKMSG